MHQCQFLAHQGSLVPATSTSSSATSSDPGVTTGTVGDTSKCK